MAETGVIGLIEGKDPASRIVALRADMDALPIQEENDVPYKSTRPGIMHACGHDVHTTCLLGAARILQELRSEWTGTIKLIFQPGEERNPGGASILIREGVLEGPRPEAIFGMHVNPQLETGAVSSPLALRGGRLDMRDHLKTGLSSKALDIDGNGLFEPLIDGLLAINYGLDTLTADTFAAQPLGVGASRTSFSSVSTYLNGLLP